MPDFGFVGPSYTTVSPYQDAQECINFYPEIDATKQAGQRGVIALYPAPGLNIVQQVAAGQEVRGMRALSGGQYLISAIGNKVYKTVVSGSGYTTTQIGTLATSDGLVSMTDNQSVTYGLYAYMADGVNRYVWFAGTNTFTTLPSTDGAWQGADFVDVVDTYIVYNEPGTQNFGATDYDSPYSTTAYYGTKDGSPDNIMGIFVDHRQIYLIGEKTTEVWVDVGSQIEGVISFPFQRVSGTTMQHGTAAPWTMARIGESFAFLSRDERGTTIVGQVNGYQFQRLSNHAVEASLIGYQVSDAFAYTYQILGHEFYVITVPEADLTWVYDSATQMWHKWMEWSGNEYTRIRSNCMAFFNNDNFTGGYNDGTLYNIHSDYYLFGTDQVRRLRRAPHLVADFQRQYFEELQIQFQPGVGVTDAYFDGELATEDDYALLTESGDFIEVDSFHTPGADPQAMLRWSDDGGSTWSNEHWKDIGKIGQYKNRCIWRRLGWARDRVFEVVVTDPVKMVIVSANLKGSGADN
jgi:hypothetical protein